MKVELDTLLLSVQTVLIVLWYKEHRTARARVRELDEIAGEFNAMARLAKMMDLKTGKPDS